MFCHRRKYARRLIVLVLTLTGLMMLIWRGTPLTGGRAAAQTTSDSWTHCAAENEFCAFQGTKTVRYGAGGTYYTQTFTAGVAGGIQCSSAVFGDPIDLSDLSPSLPIDRPTLAAVTERLMDAIRDLRLASHGGEDERGGRAVSVSTAEAHRDPRRLECGPVEVSGDRPAHLGA